MKQIIIFFPSFFFFFFFSLGFKFIFFSFLGFFFPCLFIFFFFFFFPCSWNLILFPCLGCISPCYEFFFSFFFIRRRRRIIIRYFLRKNYWKIAWLKNILHVFLNNLWLFSPLRILNFFLLLRFCKKSIFRIKNSFV